MTDDNKRANRRIVGLALIGSAVVMMAVVGLIYAGVFEVSGDAQRVVAGILGVVAALDLLMAVYFLVSNPS
jgi:small neutral amino acid transporter SnatA (MarC family)